MGERSRATVLENLARIRGGIEEACARAGREPGRVVLVAAAKTVEAEAVRWVVEAGLTDVGENYVQELRTKQAEVPGVTWHFIGTLQSHTAQHVAELADVVETVVPGRGAARLGRRAAERGRRLPSLLEVDFTEEGRSGVRPEDAPAAADELSAVDGLSLVGLMTLPPLTPTAEEARPYFRRLRELRDELAHDHPDLVELSMGMSLDYQVAVEEGATMVRIGTALFGERPPTR
jgi:PLP dependent protein